MERKYKFFFAIEGIDKSGKTTLFNNLKIKFAHTGYKVGFIPEFNSNILFDKIRDIVEMNWITVPAISQLHLIIADKLTSYIELSNFSTDYDLIIADRFTETIRVYQATSNKITNLIPDKDFIAIIKKQIEILPEPDYNIFLDVPPDIAQKRANKNLMSKLFLKNVYNLYIERRNNIKDKYYTLSSDLTINELAETVFNYIRGKIE